MTARCCGPDVRPVAPTTATYAPRVVRWLAETGHRMDGRWRHEMIGTILGAVFQLLGAIFGFVGTILGAIF